MDVYFVNCLLACIIAYGFGYWMGNRAAMKRYSMILSGLASGQISVQRIDEKPSGLH
jgi:hypothetical protein